MKRMLLVIALSMLLATGALAQGNTCIGMFTDATVSVCSAGTTQYVITSVHFYAILDEAAIPSISAAEFKVTNWPVAGAQGLITYAWNTPLVLGEPSTDVAFAFNPPLSAPHAYIGRVDFFPIDGAWIGSDHLMQIAAGNGQDGIWVVYNNETKYGVGTGTFKFNGTQACDCPPTATEERTWGAIKALY